MSTLNQNQHADHPGITAQHQQNTASEASNNKDKVPPVGPASGSVDFDGISEASNLYPLEDGLKRDDLPGHEDKDLGINSDETNPGTEYLPPLNDYGEHLSR